MNTAVVALSVTTFILGLVVAGLAMGFHQERRDWASERRVLLDRVIARHTGEVIALDRTASPRRSSQDNEVDRPVPVGL